MRIDIRSVRCDYRILAGAAAGIMLPAINISPLLRRIG